MADEAHNGRTLICIHKTTVVAEVTTHITPHHALVAMLFMLMYGMPGYLVILDIQCNINEWMTNLFIANIEYSMVETY